MMKDETRRLGNVSIPDEELIKDRKNVRRSDLCGIGKGGCILAVSILTEGITTQISSVKRIFKRIAISKGWIYRKMVFGTLSYLVVVYEDGKKKQCNFKHEEDVDRFLAYIERISGYSGNTVLRLREKLPEKEKMAGRKAKRKKCIGRNKKMSREAGAGRTVSEKAIGYLYMDLSQSAKKKRTL